MELAVFETGTRISSRPWSSRRRAWARGLRAGLRAPCTCGLQMAGGGDFSASTAGVRTVPPHPPLTGPAPLGALADTRGSQVSAQHSVASDKGFSSLFTCHGQRRPGPHWEGRTQGRRRPPRARRGWGTPTGLQCAHRLPRSVFQAEELLGVESGAAVRTRYLWVAGARARAGACSSDPGGRTVGGRDTPHTRLVGGTPSPEKDPLMPRPCRK